MSLQRCHSDGCLQRKPHFTILVHGSNVNPMNLWRILPLKSSRDRPAGDELIKSEQKEKHMYILQAVGEYVDSVISPWM